jgi:hypothetical protein
VSSRTREIGIRVALGSKPSQVVVTTLGRSLIQLATGTVESGVDRVVVTRDE